MKICKNCNIEFKPVGSESCCTIRCRLIYGVKKEGDCWIWQGSTAGHYGKVRLSGVTYSTHKASFIVFRGEVPDGKLVCHTCDIKLCINPDHLWIGTQKENLADARSKNRISSGENNHFSRYTDKQIEEMRILRSEGFSYIRLTRIFNCSMTTVYNVIKNKSRIKV